MGSCGRIIPPTLTESVSCAILLKVATGNVFLLVLTVFNNVAMQPSCGTVRPASAQSISEGQPSILFSTYGLPLYGYDGQLVCNVGWSAIWPLFSLLALVFPTSWKKAAWTTFNLSSSPAIGCISSASIMAAVLMPARLSSFWS